MFNRRLVLYFAYLVCACVLSLVLDQPVKNLLHVPVALMTDSGPCTVSASLVSAIPETPIVLNSNGVVRFLPCTDGKISLQVEGSSLNGIGAHFLISQFGENLWEGPVIGEHTLEAEVLTGGWVMLAFVNDDFEGDEGRNLWINDLRFVPL